MLYVNDVTFWFSKLEITERPVFESEDSCTNSRVDTPVFQIYTLSFVKGSVSRLSIGSWWTQLRSEQTPTEKDGSSIIYETWTMKKHGREV